MKFIIGLSVLLSLVAADALAADLYPIAKGNEWTYVVNSTYGLCPSGEKTSSVLSEQTVAGREAFQIQGACSGVSPIFFAVNGETVDSEYDGTWWRDLDTAQEGHTWQEFRTTATWNEIGTITVQAGTFQNCWRKTRNVSYTDTSDYCPGVGMIRSHMVDLAGGLIDMELKSFKLQ